MVDIPETLISAIKEQRTVLFLGAGASLNAQHPNGDQIPLGDNLRNLICERFLGGELIDRSLSIVAALAANEAGLLDFQSYIRDLLLPFEPADFHMRLSKFHWRAIVTTNFDLIVERAYDNSPKVLQKLVKTVKDGDQFNTRMNRETNPVPLYKLHGCIDHFTDMDIPFILSDEQYAHYEKNRTRFYNRFRDLGYEYPIVFAGYSISDSHIQRILFDLTDPKIGRPPFFLISPDIGSIEERYWNSNRVVVLKTSLEEFLERIDQAISPLERALPITIGGGALSIRDHYRVANPAESLSLVGFLDTDVTHVHSGLTSSKQEPEQFYRGYDNGWGCILQNLDARRSFTDSVLVDAILTSDESRQLAELFMLKGPGGNGKSVSLKRLAWETGVTYGQLAFYSNGAAGLRIEPFTEIYRLTGKRIFWFVDHVAFYRNETKDLLHASKAQSIPLSIIGAERDNEWNIYCDQLEPFVRQEFPVRYLNEREIELLLNLLECHKALGLLDNRTSEERTRAFTEDAGRQLLVALHEATLGVPFEDIVLDEFLRIEPMAARNLYLDICSLHQFGAPLRAGLVSRASGIRFEDFSTELIGPLENVVHVVTDQHNRDIYYSSRHQHVAEIVFNRALPAPEDKFDILARMLTAINVDYSSDWETFSRLIKGRGIADIFPNVDLGRLYYDRVQEAVPGEPFIFHQRAVFEMQHPEGDLSAAEEAAARAYQMNPKSRSIQHTQAEIARRQANTVSDPVRKNALRRVVREKLGGTISQLSEYDLHTRARLAIDEFKELVESFDEANGTHPSRAIIDAAKEVETTIQRGQQLFPESPQLLATEATFRECLDQTNRAVQILERAFNLNPRQDWLAVRLARKYQRYDDHKNCERVLQSCIQNNPSSKVVHLEMGLFLVASGERSRAIEHLRRSFTPGDNRYEAQFWYARELFRQGRFDEAEGLFRELNERAPGHYRTRASADQYGKEIVYEGRVERKEEGYAFIGIPQFPKDLFASRGDNDEAVWDDLYTGIKIHCTLGFSRRGARAINISLAQ